MKLKKWLDCFLTGSGSSGMRRSGGLPVGAVPGVLEGLESRELLTANLQVLSAAVVSGTGQTIVDPGDKPVIGERMRFEVSWQGTGLSGSESYTVAIIVDGKSFPIGQTFQGNGTGGNGTWTRSVLTSFATAGAHTIEAVVDSRGLLG